MDAVIPVPFINIVIIFLSSSIMQHANCWWLRFQTYGNPRFTRKAFLTRISRNSSWTLKSNTHIEH